MKFINYLESITGVGIYPLASLLIFFIFFTALIVWAFSANKEYIRSIKNIPFSEKDNSSLFI